MEKVGAVSYKRGGPLGSGKALVFGREICFFLLLSKTGLQLFLCFIP